MRSPLAVFFSSRITLVELPTPLGSPSRGMALASGGTGAPDEAQEAAAAPDRRGAYHRSAWLGGGGGMRASKKNGHTDLSTIFQTK